MKHSLRPWKYGYAKCVCGLLNLRNELTARAMKQPCKWWDE